MKNNKIFFYIAILSIIFCGISISIITYNNFLKEENNSILVKLQGDPPVLVETAIVENIILNYERNVVGTVKAVHYIDVRPELAGTIVQVAPAGTQATKDEVLFRIDDQAEQTQLKHREANLELMQKNTQRADRLVNKTISKADQQAAYVNLAQAVSEHEALRSTLRKMTISAPFTGVTSFHDLTPGQAIQPGQILFTFYDPTKLYVEFSIPETDIGTLHPGVKISVMDTVTGHIDSATITLINSEMNISNRMLTLRAIVDSGLFRHGSSIRVSYPVKVPEPSLVIPKAAINYTAYGQSVFVVQNYRAKVRSIITGNENKGLVQVLQGLNAGEMVVTAGQIRLYSDAPVRLREKE